MSFRALSPSEVDLLARLYSRGRIPRVDLATTKVFIQHEGNFTVAVLNDSPNAVSRELGRLRVGVAKRSVKDVANRQIGEHIALVRAVRNSPVNERDREL